MITDEMVSSAAQAIADHDGCTCCAPHAATDYHRSIARVALEAALGDRDALIERLAEALERARFAIFSSDMTVKDSADQACRVALAAKEQQP